MTKGAFGVFPADKAGLLTRDFSDPQKPVEEADINSDKAVDIYFAPVPHAPHPLPKDQVELHQEIEKVLRVIRQLYLRPRPGSDERRKAQFRACYVRLFRLSQVGLEGENVFPDIAKSALTALAADVIDDEAGRVKNSHLKELGVTAGTMASVLIVAYLVLRLVPQESWFASLLQSAGVDRMVFANFMLLWVGCLIGVWLSYGVRTAVFSLADLTVTDSDRLLPMMRLLFAGAFTTILGIMFIEGVIKVSLGDYSVTNFSSSPMLALLIGAFCGITELALPATVSKRAADFIGKLK